MSNSDWRDSELESGKPRPAIQGRTEFEDSLLAARREEQAQKKRRSAALSQALKARSIDSDPLGKKFLADRQKAMAARRAENAKLDRANKPETFSVSLFDVWAEAAPTGRNEAEAARKRNRRIFTAVGAIVAVVVVIAGLWLWSRVAGS